MAGEGRKPRMRPLRALEITGCYENPSTIQSASDRSPQSVRNRSGRLILFADPQTGVAPEVWTPRPPYAFKMSMFNVFCNSH